MASKSGERGDGLRDRAFAWYWERQARRVKDPGALRRLMMRRRAVLERIANRAEAALLRGAGPRRAPGAVWSMSPDILITPQSPSAWTGPRSGFHPARGLSIYHDAPAGGFTLSQRPNRAPDAAHRFELFFESYDFEGAYLSLAVAIPEELRRPKVGEVVRVIADLAASRPIKTFLRFNLASSSRTDVLHADGELGAAPGVFDFDLAFAAFEPGPGDAVWIDLIFDRPRMIEFALRDLEVRLVPRGAP